MIYRGIIKDLEKWKSLPNRKPLVLRGARQVGKTTSVREFSKQYPQFIYLNLEQPEHRETFEQFKNIDELVSGIFFQHNAELDKTTLLFIDEIQESPEAIQALRYFYEERPEIHVIAAGSLLETLFDHEINFPVGRVEYRILRPLSFMEFLGAMQEEKVAQTLNKIPLPSYAYSKTLDLFHTYTLMGGMPEVVANYCRYKDFTRLIPIYDSLLASYIDDVEKYARSHAAAQVLHHVIKACFTETGKRIKFEGFGKSNYRSKEIGEALRTLQKAMILQLVYPTTEVKPPIIPDLKKSPRLQLLDTGLLNYFSGVQKSLLGIDDLNDVYKGIIAEHIVGQELTSIQASVLDSLSFWVREKRQSSSEIDFLFQYDQFLVPIEVKSGKTGTLRSLFNYMDQTDHSYAVRLYPGPLKIDQLRTVNGKDFSLLNLPYFLISKIREYLEWFIREAGK